MEGSLDIPNTDSEGKSKWLVKENQEEMPHVSDLNDHDGAILSLSLPVYLSTCTVPCFPPNKHLTVSL